MAAINSLKDGYFNESGVMSATPSSTTSCLIKHCVMIQSNCQLKSVGFSSASDAAGVVGRLAIGPKGGTLTITNASCAVRLVSVGAVASIPSAPSVPLGLH